MSGGAVRGALVCGGQFHDIDFARLELLRGLAELDHSRTAVGDDYSVVERAHDRGQLDFLITYTCNVIPSAGQQELLRDWVAKGGRWFALHGTNSVLRFTREGVEAPDDFPRLAELLGSRFIAHPPIEPYRVDVVDDLHWFTEGLKSFEATDELYLCEHADAELVPLLTTTFSGDAEGFVTSDWTNDDPTRLVAYLRPWHAGEVLYLTLGHCRSHLDMQPHVERWPTVDRAIWNNPAFQQLVERGLRWATEQVSVPA